MYQSAGGGAVATGGALAFTGFGVLAYIVAGVSLLVFGLAMLHTGRRVPKATD